jgi:DNA segregation ATPase FtsK/SpoIIIE, S-DNA-T family
LELISMSGCKFPEHHKSASGGGSFLALAVLAVVVGIAYGVVSVVLAAVAFVAAHWLWFVLPPVVVAGLVLARPVMAVYRAARAGRDAWPYLPAMWWAALRWRWLARNAGLAYIDRHHGRKLQPRIPGTTAVRVNPEPIHKLRWPVARFTPTPHGWTAIVKTVPKVGRPELSKAAPWLADAWRSHRVSVTQVKPGRVQLAALRTDPLTEPYGAADCPPGTFDSARFPARLFLGRDETAAWRTLPLANTTGITVTGLPGAGKSNCLQGWLCQFAGSPLVSPLILDGKGGAEWSDWDGRAVVLGDDLDAAEDALAVEVREMQDRHARVLDVTGHRNAWQAGPSPDMPLRLVVLDECHTYLDVAQHKGTRNSKEEHRARVLGQFVSTLVRKGRSVLYLVILATQQGTVDAFGSSQLRNNCALSLAFGLRTTEAAVAALGEDIRQYPDMSPTQHQGPELVGVATCTLRTGLDPFTRLRVPELTEEAARARAASTAHLGRRRRLHVVDEVPA